MLGACSVPYEVCHTICTHIVVTKGGCADRWQRISMNDIENAFLALVVIWGTYSVGTYADLKQTPISAISHQVFTIMFTVSRVGHTLS